tara:strand:+ start:161 stop:2314 length:2154 start_codon:yes stop_codon:yes gene_type:complete
MFEGRTKMATEEDIAQLDDKQKQSKFRELDTGITTWKKDLENLSEEKPDSLQGSVQKLMWGTRRVEKLGSKEKIQARINEFEKLRNAFGMGSSELHSVRYKPSADEEWVTFGELVDPQGKTEKEWVGETLQILYDNLINNQDEYAAKGLFDFINTLHGGKSKDNWTRKLGNLITPSEDFSKVMAKVQNLPDVNTSWSSKIQSAFGGTQAVAAKRTPSKKPEETRGKTRGKTISSEERPGEDVKGITRHYRASGLREEYDTASVKSTAPADILRFNLSKFKRLMDLLHQSTVTKDTLLAPFKGLSENFLFDMAIGPSARGGITLDGAIKDIDMGRKGITASHREKNLKHLFSIYYLNSRLKNEPSMFTVGPYELFPDSEELTDIAMTENEENKIKAIAWVKKHLASGKSERLSQEWKKFVQKTPITSRDAKEVIDEMQGHRNRNEKVPAELQAKYDKIVDESELGDDASKHLQSFLGSSFDYDDIVEPYNVTGRWRKTMFAWLISVFAESNSKEEFTNNVSEFITAGETFIDRLPQGELFAGQDKQSFVDSMIIVLTIVKRFHGQEELQEWDQTLLDITDTYYTDLENLLKELAELEGVEYPQEKDFLISLLVEQDIVAELDPPMGDSLGVGEELKKLYDTISPLVFELGTQVISVIIQLIEKIGKDTTGKYLKARPRLKAGAGKAEKMPIINHLAMSDAEGGLDLLQWDSPKQDEEE